MSKKIKMNDFTNFMRWLWNNDRETYTLIMLGHTELINKELMDKYKLGESKIMVESEVSDAT